MTGIAELLPLAVGVIVSPLPVVAVLALLLAPRGRLAGPAFAAAYVTVGVVVTVVAAVGTRGVTRGRGDAHDLVTVVLAGALTVVFVVLAVLAWRGRPRPGSVPRTPRWMAALDTVGPGRAAGLGVLLAITDGKNLGLQLHAGVLIDGLDAATPVLVGVAIGFALVAGIGVLAPVLLTLLGPASVHRGLVAFRDEIVRHTAAVMTVLFALLAALEAAHVAGYLLR